MKKIYIALAVLAAAALTSCEKERSHNDLNLDANSIAFTLQGAAKTRTAESGVVSSQYLPVKIDLDGRTYSLEETVVRMDSEVSPATKGTPAYTSNVSTLYGSFNALAHVAGSSTVAIPDGAFQYDSGVWVQKYATDPWANGESLFFYMRMPASPAGVSNLVYGSPAEGKISFNYTSPETAAEQQDILFAGRPLTKSQYVANYEHVGAPVLFHHALTGVKFAIGNDDDDIAANQVKITKVEFSGLYGQGSCVVTPRKEAGQADYEDNETGDYSSGDGSTVVWTTSGAITNTYSATFNADGTTVDFTSGSFENMGSYPDSFSAAGNTKNLNDGDATQTFWLIPQAMTDDVKLAITFSYGGTTKTFAIDFGEVLAAKNVVWKAGEIRTYSLRVNDVNVKIEDELVTEQGLSESGITLYGGTKSNVVITNTGNTDAYIRAAIVGQWVDENDNPVFSFTDFTDLSHLIKDVDSWYMDQFVTEARTFGTFSGLVGYNADYSGDWVKGDDGYYYYKKVVPAGESIPSTDPLFESFTVNINNIPQIRLAGQLQQVHLMLDVATQAISAKRLDGSNYPNQDDGGYQTAWANAKAQ